MGNEAYQNFIGAQHLEMPKGSHTRVRLTVRSVDSQQTAYILLKAKELEQDAQLGLPAEMIVTADQSLERTSVSTIRCRVRRSRST